MLPSAIVVARSFHRHHPEHDFFTLLADAPTPTSRACEIPGTVLGIADLGRQDLLRRAFRLGQQELSYALTPALLVHLLDRGYDAVLFYKQESLLVGRQDEAIARLRSCQVLLTPHLLAPLDDEDATERERTILLSGAFNVGFLGVADGPQARELLAWWDARLETHCRHDVARGLHFEQRWMDLAPSLFDGVQTLRDPAYNVGHWNVTERAVTAGPDGEDVRVGGRPCALVRFSGYDPAAPQRMTRYLDRVPVDALGDAASVFARYRAELLDAGWEHARGIPYGYGAFSDGVAVPAAARGLHATLADDEADRLGDPFAVEPDGFRAWATRPLDAAAPPVSRLMLAVHGERPDLVEAFPDPLGRDRDGLVAWWHDHRAEHGAAPALDPVAPVTKGPAAVTVVTAGRLPQARVLGASLQAHQPDLPLHVVLVGSPPADVRGDAEPFTFLPRPIPGGGEIDDLLLRGRETDAAVRAKAAGMLALLHAGHDRVLYLDADTEAVGGLDPLLDAAGDHEITLVPHALDPPASPRDLQPELLLLVAGAYNAGVVAVRAGAVAQAFLHWWGKRTAAGAGYGPHEGVFHDQRWLDLVPGLFDGVGVLRDDRFDIGPWNLRERDEAEWRLLHYSGFDPREPDVLSAHHPGVTFAQVPRAREAYRRYGRILLEAGWDPAGPGPPVFADGVRVPPFAAEIARSAAVAAFDRADLLRAGPGSLRDWLTSPADVAQPAISNLWVGLHGRRADLREAFPDPLGTDRAGFARWCRTAGAAEYVLDAAFAPAAA